MGREDKAVYSTLRGRHVCSLQYAPLEFDLKHQHLTVKKISRLFDCAGWNDWQGQHLAVLVPVILANHFLQRKLYSRYLESRKSYFGDLTQSEMFLDPMQVPRL
jgi:hypothetical protein